MNTTINCGVHSKKFMTIAVSTAYLQIAKLFLIARIMLQNNYNFHPMTMEN